MGCRNGLAWIMNSVFKRRDDSFSLSDRAVSRLSISGPSLAKIHCPLTLGG